MSAPSHAEPAVTPELAKEHGLAPDEFARILEICGRTPSYTELGIFSAMWNEHCSYKSSKKWLRTLPTEGPQVICGPGENAGVVDIGDGQAVVFKMESHNHPSYIEPYQGAATGVGGILRDVFTMGARPIAAMNALSFGEPDHPKTRSVVAGVVEGVGGYGNCFGVPTVGGEVRFHPAYNGNCLVNAFAAGLADTDKIFYSAASGVGMPVVYLGAKTGRDGVGGATMASAEFDETIDALEEVATDPAPDEAGADASTGGSPTDADSVAVVEDGVDLGADLFEAVQRRVVGVGVDDLALELHDAALGGGLSILVGELAGLEVGLDLGEGQILGAIDINTHQICIESQLLVEAVGAHVAPDTDDLRIDPAEVVLTLPGDQLNGTELGEHLGIGLGVGAAFDQ